jgi:hypothetical protein
MMTRSPVWLVPAAVYLASLSAIFALETEAPSPRVLLVFTASILAGLTARRFSTPALLVAGVAVSLLWLGWMDEDDPVVVIVGGLLLGVAVARTSEHALGGGDAPAHRWRHAKRLLRRVVTRHTFEVVDDLLDRLRFRIDTLPDGVYQPVPVLSTRATRGTGSESRWDAMLPVIREQAIGSGLDIGASEGYFALQLAEARIPTMAVERAPSTYRTALLAVKRSGTRDVGVLALEITPENVVMLPSADCVLCLSVWHHFVRAQGLHEATAMLAAIWERTRKVMFFDTGEAEMTPDYNLPPMTPGPRVWLEDYLRETCAGSRVEHLGLHRAFDPSGRPCERNLFAVIRDYGD